MVRGRRRSVTTDKQRRFADGQQGITAMTFLKNLTKRSLSIMAVALILAAARTAEARVVGVVIGHADITQQDRVIDSGALGAEEVAAAFRKFPEATVHTRTGKEATRDAILDLFDRTADVVREGDVVPVFICAHGGVD